MITEGTNADNTSADPTLSNVHVPETNNNKSNDVVNSLFSKKTDRHVKRVGIIGYGHLGQFLRLELSKHSANYRIHKIWNRTEEAKENVLPLSDLDEYSAKSKENNVTSNENDDDYDDVLSDIDLVIEVASPEVVKRYAKRILKHCDLFIASTAALADSATLEIVENALKNNRHRRIFVPSASAFWGTEDIRLMSKMGTLKKLKITILKHPNALRLKGPIKDLCQKAQISNFSVVLFDGPVRLLCSSAPSIANMIASTALAANNLGFDNTHVKLIADPVLTNWNIVEYEVTGENGFRTTCRRESPAQPDVISNEDNTYYSILSSIKESFYKPPGFNIC